MVILYKEVDMSDVQHFVTQYSAAYVELVNLKYAAIFHKAHCTNSDCNVTLFSLRKTAQRLLRRVYPHEKKAAIEIWEQMPIV
jgi:hypothetical protein